MLGKIALEEHFALEETLAASERYAVNDNAWNDLSARLLDLDDRRLAEMDRHGIALAFQSLNAPGIQEIPDRRLAIDAARKANDVLAGAIARHPDRYGGFAALPMQDPQAASDELTRAVRQ